MKRTRTEQNRLKSTQAAAAALVAVFVSGCANMPASMKKALAIDDQPARLAPIANPFNDYYYAEKGNQPPENIILRTKKGDRAVEVEIPGKANEITDLVIPMAPSFKGAGNVVNPGIAHGYGYDDASGLAMDEAALKTRAPSISDREITHSFTQGTPQNESMRTELESQLGLQAPDDSIPEGESSYLATVDYVKQLYRASRFEAALLKIDELLRQYPTDSKLYEMRGTLFDRIGRPDLALTSWNQALRFDPNNAILRKFVERKQLKRSILQNGSSRMPASDAKAPEKQGGTP